MSAEQSAPTTAPVTTTTYPNCSLYVGDLRSDVGESDIYDAFKECGNILSVRVCRDVKDQRSLGYAYVNYQNPENAQKALDTLNGKPLKGKPCRIMWSCRDPSQRKSSEGNVFVKNLDKSVTLIQLQDVFSHFGAISSCKVQTKDDGTSLCYGFVQFAKVEDSVKALEACKNDSAQFKSLGEKFIAEKFIPKHLRANNANDTYTNLYIKNIGKKFTSEDLKKLFESYGDITSAIVMTDKGESRRFGFVNFSKHEFAVKAKDGMDGKTLKWKDEAYCGPLAEGENEEQLKKDNYVVQKLYVNRAQKKHERENILKYERILHGSSPSAKTNVYVRNLSDSVSDDDLRNLFREYGEVKSCVVMKYPNGTSRGFGFCDFASNESALQAIQKVMNHLFHGKPLYLALAQKKSERHEILQSQHSQMRFFPPMGNMYRQPIFAPGMFYNMPPNMYPSYNQRNMYTRQAPYPRQFSQPRHNMNRRGNKQVTMAPQMQQPQAPQPVAQPQPAPVSPENEKQRIGEAIYSRIMPLFPNDTNLWGKLTGMLLESIPLDELRTLVADETALNEKINQAKEYYDQHMENAAK